MYIHGVVLNVVFMLLHDYNAVSTRGVFGGYAWTTAAVVAINATNGGELARPTNPTTLLWPQPPQPRAGLVVSAVLKFCDNIARVYAHSIAMVATLLLSAALFRLRVTLQLVVALLLVMISTLQ